MRKLLLLMTALLTLGASGAWAQITVSPSTGVYWKNGAVSSHPWAPIWKSSVTASDGSTPLLVMTAGTGIDTSNGDIYASTYTLEVPAGYVLSSYTLNGTATGGDVTITPSGESATVISNGNSLADALAVTVRAQSTSFVLAGGHLANVALNVTVSPTPVIVAMNSADKLPSAYGAFSGQTFTTAAASGLAGVTITASSGLTINEATVNVDNYGKCFSLATAAAATDYTVTMTAPTGYVITGYYLGGSANTKDAAHTLTSADGSVSVVASAPTFNIPAYAPKVFEVTGLNTNSTYFTINTANKANTLYLPTFYIYVAKASEVVDVTYNVMFNGSQVTTATASNKILGSAPALPSSHVKDYCTYTYYSDAACTQELTQITSTTVYAKCTAPFEASTTFNSATWYYLKLKDANYPTYVAGGTPNVTLPTTNAGDRTTQWAFFGNPYDGFTLKNRAAGNDLVLGSASPNGDGNTGGATYATLGTSGSQTYEVWIPVHSSHYTNGFFLQTSEGYALNQRSTDNLAFWTGGKDSGSTFVVEAAPSDAEYLTTLRSNYTIDAANLDKPGFPTTAAYNTFRSAIEAYASIEDAEANLATDLATLRAATVYPNGTYYIKNRQTGCYAFITDDGELVPRIKIDNTVSHANNNYLWTVTSDKSAGTCSIVSSLYSNVPFAKGDNNYANITSSNRTVITTLSTELFSSNNGTSGGFYLNGAHNNNTYTGNGEGSGNSHIVNWTHEDSPGSQWIFEPVDLGTAYTVTVAGLDEGGQDAVTLSDGTIVNLGTATVYLSEAPTTSNITQGEISGYSIQDGSIVIDGTTVTVTYSPSYDVLIANYWNDNNIAAKLANAGQYGYPATDNEYTVALNGVKTAIASSSYTGNATNYNNLKTWYAGFLAADVVTPPTGKFYRFKANATGTYMGYAESGKQPLVAEGNAAVYFYTSGKQFVNYNTGRYLSGAVGNAVTAVGTDGPAFNFYKSGYSTPTMGTVRIRVADNSNGSIIAWTDNYLNGWGVGNHERCEWIVEPVTSLPVTFIGEYASFYSPVDLTIPGDAGVKVYTGTVNGEWLTLNEVTGTLPANTGVILKGTAGQTVNFPILSTTTPAESALTGTVAAQPANANGVLVLGKSNNVWGIYNYEGTLGGFKAYMPKTAGVKGFSFRFGDTDAIQSISDELSRSEIYDISGRRVTKPTQGLYIVNGKKVVIK
jgi:hypothetical protein